MPYLIVPIANILDPIAKLGRSYFLVYICRQSRG
jgi:hypothetical protein